MSIIDFMIILFYLKLDTFYCIGTMNWLKMICYDLFYVHIKMSYYFLIEKSYRISSNKL